MRKLIGSLEHNAEKLIGLCGGIGGIRTMYGLGNSIYPEGTQNFDCGGIFTLSLAWQERP